MLPASFAACVPVFIATATSACASAGRVVRAVAGHGDEAAARLVLADELELRLGRRLGEEVVDARLGGDGRGGERVVAGDHHRLDAHPAQLGEALLDAALDDVLELDDAERRLRALGDDERRAALLGDLARRRRGTSAGTLPPLAAARSASIGVGRALADLRGRRGRRRSCASARVNGTNVRAELVRRRARAGRTSPSRARRCCGPRASRRRARRAARHRPASSSRHAGRGQERRRLAVAERDRAGLVEQQHVDVAGRLDRAARHGDHVRLDHPVHAGDADRREQPADRRRDEADEQRDEHGDR